MRSLLVILSFVSSSAFACPTLTGNYKECRSTTGNSTGSADMIVTQKVQNRITTYTVSAVNRSTQERETEIYIADGKVRVQEYTEPSSGLNFKMSQKVFCEPNAALNIHIDVAMEGQAVGWSKVRVTKVGNQQFIASTYFNGEQETSDVEICE